ncbi:hypothetical protein SNEBB_003312 [Seison nebaliae]|nr:hypothetical protein SNEBB_003312 [Seison nebaliae]
MLNFPLGYFLLNNVDIYGRCNLKFALFNSNSFIEEWKSKTEDDILYDLNFGGSFKKKLTEFHKPNEEESLKLDDEMNENYKNQLNDIQLIKEYLDNGKKHDFVMNVTSGDHVEYFCVLPKNSYTMQLLTDKEEKNIEKGDEESKETEEEREEKRTFLESRKEKIIKKVIESKRCYDKVSTYWTYKLCHGEVIKQYREERNGAKKEIQQEFILGEYLGGLNSILHPNDQKHKVVEYVKRVIDDEELTGYLVPYSEGTTCEVMPERRRRTNVIYFCDKNGFGSIYSLDEISTCIYEIKVLSSELCQLQEYERKPKPPSNIACYTAEINDEIRPKLSEQINQEINEYQKIGDKDSIMNDLSKNGKFIVTTQGGTTVVITFKFNSPESSSFHVSADKDQQMVKEEGLPDASSIDPSLMRQLREYKEAINYEDTRKEDVTPKQLTGQLLADGPPANFLKEPEPELVLHTTELSANDVELTTNEKQIYQRFIRGEHCLNGGGTLWWKYEFCYNRHVIQYHEEEDAHKKTKRSSIVIGRWNENIHKNWLIKNEHKRPSNSKTISHFYADGQICHETKKKRQVEVKFKCATSSWQPKDKKKKMSSKTPVKESVSLILLEPQMCEYVLIIEARILCQLYKDVNNNAILRKHDEL